MLRHRAYARQQRLEDLLRWQPNLACHGDRRQVLRIDLVRAQLIRNAERVEQPRRIRLAGCAVSLGSSCVSTSDTTRHRAASACSAPAARASSAWCVVSSSVRARPSLPGWATYGRQPRQSCSAPSRRPGSKTVRPAAAGRAPTAARAPATPAAACPCEYSPTRRGIGRISPTSSAPPPPSPAARRRLTPSVCRRAKEGEVFHPRQLVVQHRRVAHRRPQRRAGPAGLRRRPRLFRSSATATRQSPSAASICPRRSRPASPRWSRRARLSVISRSATNCRTAAKHAPAPRPAPSASADLQWFRSGDLSSWAASFCEYRHPAPQSPMRPTSLSRHAKAALRPTLWKAGLQSPRVR